MQTNCMSHELYGNVIITQQSKITEITKTNKLKIKRKRTYKHYSLTNKDSSSNDLAWILLLHSSFPPTYHLAYTQFISIKAMKTVWQVSLPNSFLSWVSPDLLRVRQFPQPTTERWVIGSFHSLPSSYHSLDGG